MSQLTFSSTSPNIEVKPSLSHDSGVGVFATKALSPGGAGGKGGDIIMTIRKPMVVALDVLRCEDTCYECFRREGSVGVDVELGFGSGGGEEWGEEMAGVSLKRCTGCRVVRYCGKACQKTSWSAHHSLECAVFKAVAPRTIPNHMRAVLRVLMLRKAGRIVEQDWDALLGCEAYDVEMRLGMKEEVRELQRMAKMVVLWSDAGVDEGFVVGLLMRLKINSVTLQTPFHDPIGLALHPLLAKINHSCDPNCYIRFPTSSHVTQSTSKTSSGSIAVLPLRQIKSGEEITISYIDETIPVRYRKQELEDRYFFTCVCQKCTLETEQETRLRNEDRNLRYKLQDETKRLLDGTSSEGTIETSLQSRVENHIHALFEYNPAWSLALFPFPQLLHRLILEHIDSQNWISAFRLAALLHARVDPVVYASPIHPLRLTHLMLLIKLTGAVLDQLSSDSQDKSATSEDAIQLAKEMDLELMLETKTELLIAQASRSWTEHPWPWMADIIRRKNASGPSRNKSILDKQKKKEEELCEQTLESLKRA